MEGLTPGRIVHYVLGDGQIRPLMVVRVWGDDGKVNGQVFTDGSNDREFFRDDLLAWATSVAYDAEGTPGTWHWPPRDAESPAVLA